MEIREQGSVGSAPAMAAGLEQHERWMRQALHESHKALPGCIPNPPVGCLIVFNGTVLARGYTNPPGSAHAEAMALSHLSGAAAGAHVYVTLEPCSFEGRTPSCAAALVAAGVAHVYVGVIDPDPRNQGRGVQMLRDAGITVDVGILANEIEKLLDPYLIRP